MNNFYRFGILGLMLLFFLGWILNCTGLETTPRPHPIQFAPSEMKASAWIETPQWTNTNIFDLPARTCQIKNNSFDSRTLEEAQLFVYAKVNNQIRLLPFSTQINESELRFDYTFSKNTDLKIVAIGSNGNLAPLEEKISYRYLLISNSLIKKINADMRDYASIKALLDLKD
ncbi:MAG: hypothetical protein ACK4GN_04260 [Runella sp.]